MKIISLFNNKGGVGKTTLAYHLSHILSDMGKKVLIMDLDPQCNLSICCIDEEKLHQIWKEEDAYIVDFDVARKNEDEINYKRLLSEPRSIHFVLKPTEDGAGELESLPPPIKIKDNLHLVPGRLSAYNFENKISERWSGSYLSDPLSIRTISRIRKLAEEYAKEHGYDIVIMDTSPSLGILNKVIISTVDGFLIPCWPDMFSLYGIRNIGQSLTKWQKEFTTLYKLISDEKRQVFPKSFVRFLGYTIYNAKKYAGVTDWDLSRAHYNYARMIPDTIREFISTEVREHLSDEVFAVPIGETSIMHSHNTLPNMTQKYKHPIWEVPDLEGQLDLEDVSTISGNRGTYYATKEKYRQFAIDLLLRIDTLGDGDE